MAESEPVEAVIQSEEPHHILKEPVEDTFERESVQVREKEQTALTVQEAPDSSNAAPAATVIVPVAPPAAPAPKKFSAVNINKKFLQKNSAGSGVNTVAAANASTAKSGSPARELHIDSQNISIN